MPADDNDWRLAMKLGAWITTTLTAIGIAAASGGCSDQDGNRGANVISTDVLENQLRKDKQVIAALANAGSNLSKPHLLEHHILCRSSTEANAVIAWATANRYKSSEVKSHVYEGRTIFYFDLISRTVPTIERITPQTTAMLEAAARFGVDYDGWGCEVVK